MDLYLLAELKTISLKGKYDLKLCIVVSLSAVILKATSGGSYGGVKVKCTC